MHLSAPLAGEIVVLAVHVGVALALGPVVVATSALVGGKMLSSAV